MGWVGVVTWWNTTYDGGVLVKGDGSSGLLLVIIVDMVRKWIILMIKFIYKIYYSLTLQRYSIFFFIDGEF